jgi:hypothetical protein
MLNDNWLGSLFVIKITGKKLRVLLLLLLLLTGIAQSV